MKLETLLKTIKTDHDNLMEVAYDKMIVKACYRWYGLEFNGHHYELQFNLMTLDFVAHNKLPFGLRSKIKSRIIDSDYLKWKYKKEGRTFFDFLKLYYINSEHIVFTDSESPDYIIYDDAICGYEITEATDTRNALFNEVVYRLTNLENYSKEYKTFIYQINRILTNKMRKNNTQTISQVQIYERILECISHKIEKYKNYNQALDRKNIIVFNNRILFKGYEDLQFISKGISEMKINNKGVDSIFIIDGSRNLMVEYNRQGKIVKIRENKEKKISGC